MHGLRLGMAPTVTVAYSAAAICFKSQIAVHQNNDMDDGGVRADLTFTYLSRPDNWSVPSDVGRIIAKNPGATWELCAVPIARSNDPKATPMLDVVEISRGGPAFWHERYDFPVEQALAYSADGSALVVHFGHAMDQVYMTPFHGVGDVEVPARAELLRLKLPPQDGYRITVSVDERKAGAALAIVELEVRDPKSGWQLAWRATTP
jgi:hypothetical protein